MFSISLFYFIMANSQDRRRECTLRPWNTCSAWMRGKGRLVEFKVKTQQLNIYQKNNCWQYILWNKYKNVSSSLPYDRSETSLRVAPRLQIFCPSSSAKYRSQGCDPCLMVVLHSSCNGPSANCCLLLQHDPPPQRARWPLPSLS